jgi:hypothetical protein
VVEKADAAVNERELANWARERYLDVFSKCDGMSYEQAEAFTEQRLDPEVVRLAKSAGVAS